MGDGTKRGNRRWRRGAVLALLAFGAIALNFVAGRSTPRHFFGDVAATRVSVSHTYGELPLSFEPNVGQAPSNVDYLARGAGFSIYLSRASATLALAETRATAKSGRAQVRALRINLEGADRDANASAGVPLSGVSNYFIGSNPHNWHRGVPTFAEVKYRAYPGIDVVYHGQNGRIEFDFDIGAGANPSRIVMNVDGADDVNFRRDGDAVMRVGQSSIVLRKPIAWQTRSGLRRSVDVRYQSRGPEQTRVYVGRVRPQQRTEDKKSKKRLPVLIFAPSASAGYAAMNINCPASLAPGQKCQISVTFKPTMAGPAPGLLMIHDNAIGNPQKVNLTGTGE